MEADENKSLSPTMIRNFWFTRNRETIIEFGRHGGMNAQEYYKMFSSPGLNDAYHAGTAETCAYRHMIDTHKKELADPTVQDITNLEKKHKCELKLFDVELEKMQGKEPDLSEVEELYNGYEATKPPHKRDRKPLATPQLRPTFEPKKGQIAHRDIGELETVLKVTNRMDQFKKGNTIAAMRMKFGEK
jgi:hypothetical protein